MARIDTYLGKMAGKNVTPAAPVSRLDKNLAGIADDPYVVTLTVENEDMSGTMDKTLGEITAAWTSGKQIIFKGLFGPLTAYYPAWAVFDSNSIYPSFGTNVMDTAANMLYHVFAPFSDNPDTDNFIVAAYSLTPYTP